LQAFVNKLGICCFSEIRDSLLMWSHYSDGHRGFCLEFEAEANNIFFGRALKVEYKRELKIPNILQVRNFVDSTLLTKAEEWRYEQEWRIIEHEKGSGSQKFPERLLTGIILGCLMPKDSKEKIIQLAGERSTRPKIYQATLKKNEYALEITDYE
jgi:Protein of unknown function (DUF2971)